MTYSLFERKYLLNSVELRTAEQDKNLLLLLGQRLI